LTHLDPADLLSQGELLAKDADAVKRLPLKHGLSVMESVERSTDDRKIRSPKRQHLRDAIDAVGQRGTGVKLAACALACRRAALARQRDDGAPHEEIVLGR
jgi:hypothetical protein